jgi:hypothetical protein
VISTRTPGWSDAEAERYLACQARSDDVALLGRALRRRLRGSTSLIDLGAGSGALGRTLIAPGTRWCAVEPQPQLAQHLVATMRAHAVEPHVVRERWQDLDSTLLTRAEVVLAARLPGLSDDPRTAWALCAALATRQVAWVLSLPAHDGGHGLGAFLPAFLRSPRTLVGVDAVLQPLAERAPTPHVSVVDWTWNECFADYAAAYVAFATRLADPTDRHHLDALDQHLRRHLVRTPAGLIARMPRRSAVCVFDLRRSQNV